MRTTWIQFFERHSLPGWLVPDYWFMLTTAIVIGCTLTIILWQRSGRSNRQVCDLLFWGVPSLFLGAKFFFFLQFGFPEKIDFWNTSGISLYGGLFGLLAAWTVYYLLRPYPLLLFLDCAAPALAFGLFLTRIGCFLAGCNGGIPSNLPWSVPFPRNTPVFFHQSQAGLISRTDSLSLPVHPTQLYESLFGLFSFLLLLMVLRKKSVDGQVFLTGILWYAIYRFLTEPLRSDTGGLHPFALFTFAQFISFVLALAAVLGLLLLYFPLRSRSSDSGGIDSNHCGTYFGG